VTSPWDAERVVGVERARELVGRAIPELRGTSIRRLSSGWDHTVLLVDERWVARFPRRAVALPGFHRELAVLPLLAPLLPLPVPVPRWIGTDDHPVAPWPFAVTTFLPGAELAAAGLADGDRLPVAVALGAFLRALHAPGPRDVAGADLPVDPLRRGTPAASVANTRAQLTLLSGAGVEIPSGALDRLLDDGARLAPPAGAPVLLHGDLHARHLLLRDGAAAAVIDWGDVCLGDPAVDLSLAYAAFTGAAREALLATYGRPVDGERELRARCLAVRMSAFLARYALAEGDAALHEESLQALHRALG
jgi:aminoglycoside phosphotransferase (APT) family kinase protein